MIEINFVEKEKTNLSPYILIGIFLIGVALIVVSLFIYQNHIENKQVLLTNNKEENSLIIHQVSEENEVMTEEGSLSNQIHQLKQTMYPSTYLLNQVVTILPAKATIDNYYFTITDGLKVDITTNSINDASHFVQAMNQLTFVKQSNLINLEKTSDKYRAEITFQINKDLLLEDADQYDAKVE